MERGADTETDTDLGPAAALKADRTIALRSRFEDISATLVAARSWLEDSTGQACGASWEMALAECLNNIAEHAYEERGDGKIDLWLTVAQGRLHVMIRDQGTPLPNESLPIAKAPDVSCGLDDLPEGGFGWFLIHSVTENLRYARRGAENWTGFDVCLRD